MTYFDETSHGFISRHCLRNSSVVSWSGSDINLFLTLSFEYIEDIYFFEVNTKYISSNVLKSLIFSTYEMKYFWYLPKKVNFLFIFSVQGKKLNFFLFIFR